MHGKLRVYKDFNTAYEKADAKPGEIIHFEGELPCGLLTFQKIVKVPVDVNVYDLCDRLLADEFKGAEVGTSSSVERGTHIFATFGGLREKPGANPA